MKSRDSEEPPVLGGIGWQWVLSDRVTERQRVMSGMGDNNLSVVFRADVVVS